MAEITAKAVQLRSLSSRSSENKELLCRVNSFFNEAIARLEARRSELLSNIQEHSLTHDQEKDILKVVDKLEKLGVAAAKSTSSALVNDAEEKLRAWQSRESELLQVGQFNTQLPMRRFERLLESLVIVWQDEWVSRRQADNPFAQAGAELDLSDDDMGLQYSAYQLPHSAKLRPEINNNGVQTSKLNPALSTREAGAWSAASKSAYCKSAVVAAGVRRASVPASKSGPTPSVCSKSGCSAVQALEFLSSYSPEKYVSTIAASQFRTLAPAVDTDRSKTRVFMPPIGSSAFASSFEKVRGYLSPHSGRPSLYTTCTGVPVASTARVSTAAVSTAAVSTARVSTAAVSTAAVSTARVSTAAVSTAAVSTARVSTARVSTARVSTAAVSTAAVSTAAVSTARVSTVGEHSMLNSGKIDVAPSAGTVAEKTVVADWSSNKLTPNNGSSPLTYKQSFRLRNQPWSLAYLSGQYFSSELPMKELSVYSKDGSFNRTFPSVHSAYQVRSFHQWQALILVNKFSSKVQIISQQNGDLILNVGPKFSCVHNLVAPEDAACTADLLAICSPNYGIYVVSLTAPITCKAMLALDKLRLTAPVRLAWNLKSGRLFVLDQVAPATYSLCDFKLTTYKTTIEASESNWRRETIRSSVPPCMEWVGDRLLLCCRSPNQATSFMSILDSISVPISFRSVIMPMSAVSLCPLETGDIAICGDDQRVYVVERKVLI